MKVLVVQCLCLFLTQNMCDKAVENYSKMLKCAPDCFKTHEMCEEAVKNHFFAILLTPDQYETQQICEKAISWNAAI